MRTMITSVVVSVLLGGFTVAAAQLPPEIMMDRHLLQAERLMAEEDYGAALEAMNEIVALQGEHNLTLPEEFHFKYAQAAFSAGSIPDALESVNQYLAEAGRDGEFYREALELLDEAERIQATAEQIQTEACAGQPEGTACWMESANQPECYVWNGSLDKDETVTWTGECAGGLAQGPGTLIWIWDSGQGTQEDTGRLQAGKRQGDWVRRNADGNVEEGPYVDGERHGDWVVRYENGNVEEGPYVVGKRRGQWVTRSPERTVRGEYGDEIHYAATVVAEGPYVEGQRQGHWVTRSPEVVTRTPEKTVSDDDGIERRVGGIEWRAEEAVAEGPYVEGQRHGPWVVRYKNRNVEEGPYVEGKKHGTWVEGPRQGLSEGPYVEGKKHGSRLSRYSFWTVHEGAYVEGKRHGHWVEGDSEGLYVEGKKHGHWVEGDGTVRGEGTYVEGQRHGPWVERYESGTVWK